MPNRINPYRPTVNLEPASTRVWPWWVTAMIVCLVSTLIYAIGVSIAIFVRIDAIKSPEIFGFALSPVGFAIAMFLVLELIWFNLRISLAAYVTTLVLFTALFAVVEEVYPVFIGVRKELFLPAAFGCLGTFVWYIWLAVKGEI